MSLTRRAIEALDAANIEYRYRRKRRVESGSDFGAEVDVRLPRAQVRRADAALAQAGFFLMRAPGHGRHRFYLAQEDGFWVKLDAKVSPRRRASRGRPSSASLRARLRRRGPAALGRLGPVVAILGPDGAGKGSLIEELECRIPIAVTPVYLGRGSMSGSYQALPDEGAERERRPGPVREVAFLLAKALRDWRRLARAYRAAWRGHVVLCDRHPIEVLAVRPERTRAGAALERLIASRLMPRPDAIVVLDAPAHVLYRRKGEHTMEILEAWRAGYAGAFVPMGAAVIQTTRSRERAAAQASDVIWEALVARRRWPRVASAVETSPLRLGAAPGHDPEQAQPAATST